MNNNNIKNIKQHLGFKYARSALASSILLAHGYAYALQELSDFALSQVDAQDGINMTTAYDSINIARVYWQDQVGEYSGADTAYGAYLDGVKIEKTSVSHPDLGATYNIDFSSNGANAGLAFDLDSYFDTMTVDSFKICTNSGASCGSGAYNGSFGALTIQQSSDLPLHFNFTSTDGFLNLDSLGASPANLEIGIQNFNLYLTQKTSTANVNNQFIAKDFNFNFKGKGYIGVDANRGVVLETRSVAGNYVDLIKVADPIDTALIKTKFKAGLNLEYMYKGNVPDGEFNTTNAKGVLHLGASGRVTNASIEFKGASSATDSNILGVAYRSDDSPSPSSTQIMGTTGLKMRMKADFTKDDAAAGLAGPALNAKGVTLELGHAGTNAYGIEFSNLSPLLIRTSVGGPLNPKNAYFDSGDVYINLASTKRLQMPANVVLNSARFGVGFLTTNADYSHLVHNEAANPNQLTLAVRGMEFQAIARDSRFIVSNDVPLGPDQPSTATRTWGIGLPIYNLNANIATYGTTTVSGAQAIGFGLGLSTQGVNTSALLDGTPAGGRTTSILLIDGKENVNDFNPDIGKGNPINYYFGLRNIDMLITAYGKLDLEDGKIHLDMPKLTMAASAEIAAGYLPGSKYVTGTGYAPLDGFNNDPSNTNNTDVLFGLRLKFDGAMDLSIVPGVDTLLGNRLSFDGSYTLSSGAVQIVDPIDGSILGFDSLSGKLGFSNQIKINKDNVDFNYAFTFNPNHSTDGVLRPSDLSGVFRVKDINLYPKLGSAQRLGELAITGGTLSSNMRIVPRN